MVQKRLVLGERATRRNNGTIRLICLSRWLIRMGSRWKKIPVKTLKRRMSIRTGENGTTGTVRIEETGIVIVIGNIETTKIAPDQNETAIGIGMTAETERDEIVRRTETGIETGRGIDLGTGKTETGTAIAIESVIGEGTELEVAVGTGAGDEKLSPL